MAIFQPICNWLNIVIGLVLLQKDFMLLRNSSDECYLVTTLKKGVTYVYVLYYIDKELTVDTLREQHIDIFVVSVFKLIS